MVNYKVCIATPEFKGEDYLETRIKYLKEFFDGFADDSLPYFLKNLDGTAYNPEEMQAHLVEKVPDVLVVGNNDMPAGLLKAWSDALAKEDGKKGIIIRRGTSLDAIDIGGAKKLGARNIYVFNIDGRTPGGVNSPHVADYILEKLELRRKVPVQAVTSLLPVVRRLGAISAHLAPQRLLSSNKVAIIGVGNIGGKLARDLVAKGCEVVLHSKMLSSANRPEMQKRRLTQLGLLNNPLVTVAPTMDAAFDSSITHVAVALPLIKEGKSKGNILATENIITKDCIGKLSNGVQVVSVSKPQIFTQEALTQCFTDTASKKLDFTQDYGGPSKVYVEKKYSEYVSGSVVGDLTFPENFHLTSDAMKSAGCQKAMSDAVVSTLQLWMQHKEKMATIHHLINITDDIECQEDRGKVLVLGAGIVGLITAYYLDKAGFKVEVIAEEKNPFKRSGEEDGFVNPQSGATYRRDARHFSYTEMTPRAIKSREKNIYRPISFHGECAVETVDMSSLTSQEMLWMTDFNERTMRPSERLATEEMVVALNMGGVKKWKKLLEECPDFFEGIHREKFMRVYPSLESLQEGVRQQKCYDPSVNEVTGDEIKEQRPALAAAVDAGKIAGGVYVDGFSVNVEVLSRRLTEHLEKKGVTVSWQKKVSDVTWDDQGKVSRLVVDDTVSTKVEHKNADHYVVCTGVDNVSKYFSKTEKPPLLEGVAGVWISIPNVENLTEPTKIHAHDPLGVINITPSNDNEWLHIGAGFGFVGQKKVDLGNSQMRSMLDQLKKYIQPIFPLGHAAAKRVGFSPDVCIRPMTPDGLGVFKAIEAQEGWMLTNLGHGAGGATQAPAIADQIVRFLVNVSEGKDTEPTLYEKERDVQFLAQSKL